ncbi:MAG: class I SAM-dependent methyltransferase [Candidatus Brocadiaceae bacterium]|nr:class I SAM-dependent methyltransferase [Candidatus Brocadiaceae bacterium]
MEIERIDYQKYKDKLDVYLHKKRYELAAKSISGEVLEIGCGFGYGTNLMAKLNQNGNFTAIDIDKEVIEFAKANNKRDDIKFVQMDATRLNLKNNSFDSVVTIENIEHVKDYGKYIQEIYRVLKNGGTLFLTTPNDNRFFHRIYRILGCKIKYNKYHEHEFSLKEIKTLLKKNGFKILKQGGLFLNLFPRPKRVFLWHITQIPWIYKLLVNFNWISINDYMYFLFIKQHDLKK